MEAEIEEACGVLVQHLEVEFLKQEGCLGAVLRKCTSLLEARQAANQKDLDRVVRKTKSWLTRQQADVGNDLEGIVTRVRNWLEARLADDFFWLLQIAVKSGRIKPGQPLSDMLKTPEPAGSGVKYMGELVLSIREAVPYFRELLEVLKEMRDRMPPLVQPVTGEVRGVAPIPEYKLQFDDGLLPMDEQVKVSK